MRDTPAESSKPAGRKTGVSHRARGRRARKREKERTEVTAVRLGDGERDRADIPGRSHAHNDNRDGARDRGTAGDTGRQLLEVGDVVPVRVGAERTVLATEPEDLDEHDAAQEGGVVGEDAARS